MGESTCLMQSYSGTLASTQLRDPLSESISFGRFMTEESSLSWDKWSNYSHKRYVEEAAKYSRPGSVAQKKAFFEDYYKKKALLAQESAAAAAAEVTVTQDQQSNYNTTDDTQVNSHVAPVDVVEIQNVGVALDATEIQNEGITLDDKMDEVSTTELTVLQKDVFVEHIVSEASESSITQLAGSENVDVECQPETSKADSELSATTTEVSEDSEMKKPLLKDRNANQEVSSGVRKPRPPPVPLKPSANLWPSAKTTPCPPPKAVNRSRKENVTPLSSTSLAMESLEKIKMSPKPLFSYMRTPARDGKPSVMHSSRGTNAKDSITPLRTPNVEHPVKKLTVTPKSENRRNMTPHEPATPGNRTTGPKWRYFGSLENKSRPSPTATSPFNFRTEERAVKRKEKLELKFDAKATHKVQLQTKLKEKAESELKKLRQSLCFRARPLPSFYKDRKSQKDNTSTNQTESEAEAEAPRLSKLQQTKMITKDVCKGRSLTPLPPPTQRHNSSQKNKPTNVSTAINSIRKRITHPQSLAAMISDANNSPK